MSGSNLEKKNNVGEDGNRIERSRKRKREEKKKRPFLFIIILLFFIGGGSALFYLNNQGIISIDKMINSALKNGNRVMSTENKESSEDSTETEEISTDGQEETVFSAKIHAIFLSAGGFDEEKENAFNKAKIQALQYDYDAAIETLNALGRGDDSEIQDKIGQLEEEKAKLVPMDMDQITHVFFHTLIVDVDRALTDSYKGMQLNAAMTTIPEFVEILQELYDRNYVMVAMHDISRMEQQPDGSFKMVKGQIMLPEGKTPFVMSQDDVNYYIFMEGRGFADKMLIDENGKIKNQYTDSAGNVSVGDYDLVPILDAFVEEHPDFSYHGHKAVIALTGYNGVLGYRTDETFDPNSPVYDPQNPPNPNIEEDKETVRKLTQALKDDGYEFASHSWGHINFTDRSLEDIQRDTDKWKRNVETLLPDPCEILIFPFGADIGDWHPYQSGQHGGKYDFLTGAGFRYFCNVDSTRVWMQYDDNFFRQARRNLDGYRLYESFSGRADRLSDLIDVYKVFDTRRPTPIEWK